MNLIQLLESFDGVHAGEQGRAMRKKRRAILAALKQARLCAELLLHENGFEHPEAEKLLEMLDGEVTT